MADETIDDLCYYAQVALEISQYEDMIDFIKKVVQINPVLDHDKRVLFSTAFHEVVYKKRSDITIIKHCIDGTHDKCIKKLLKTYFDKLKSEIHERCMEVIDITKMVLLPNSQNKVTELFYHKMIADYYRYDSENQPNETKVETVEQAEASYNIAIEIAKESLVPSHPIYLGLILNYCVFLVDIKGDRENGFMIARKAIEAAQEGHIEDESLESDSKICIRLLQDNLDLWTTQI